MQDSRLVVLQQQLSIVNLEGKVLADRIILKDKEFQIRLLSHDDYNKGFLQLLQQLTQTPQVTHEKFKKQYDLMSQVNENLQYQIFVIEDVQAKLIVATGSLFIESYLFKSVGNIESIVTDAQYRGLGLAQIIINKLIQCAKENSLLEVKLYCQEKTKGFYEKLQFKEKENLKMNVQSVNIIYPSLEVRIIPYDQYLNINNGDSMNKNFVFALLMLCQLICCFALSVISPFFPPYAKEKGISDEIVGIIFISNPFGAVIASIMLGKILTESNRFKYMVSGLFIQSFALYLFALTNYQNDPDWIIVTAVTARFINGFASSTFITPLYAYIPILFSDTIEQKMSIAESFASLGFLIGPAAGSFLFSLGGYLLPFIFFGSLSLLLVPPIGYQFYLLSQEQESPQLHPLINANYTSQHQNSSINKHNQVQPIPNEIREENENENENDTITDSITQSIEEPTQLKVIMVQDEVDIDSISLNYSDVLVSYPIVLTTMAAFTVNFMFNFFAPITANFFQETYQSSPDTVGYYLCVMPGAYIVNSIILANYSKNKALQIFIGSIIMGIAPFFVGPDEAVTGISHNLYVCFFGMSVAGFAAAYLYIFTVPILNEHLTAMYPQRSIACANMASALFNTGIYMGELASPPLAGILVKYYGYDRAYSILGICILVFSVCFFPVLFYTVPIVDLKKSNKRTEAIIASRNSLNCHI